MSDTFDLQKLWNLPGEAKQYAGLAKLETRSVGFAMSIGNGRLLISSQASQDGLKLIDHFSNLIGEPSLVTTDKRSVYVEYSAQWRITASIEEDILDMLRSEGSLEVPTERENKVAATVFTYL